MKQRLFSFTLCLMGILAFVFPASAETVASGTCGTNVSWTLDDAGLLTISGTGAMDDYSSTKVNSTYITTAPWGSHYADIISVVIENSVTSIGSSAFYGCSGLSSVTIPNSVTSIGYEAFNGCSGLTSIEWNAKNCADFFTYAYEHQLAPFYSIRTNISSFVFGDSVQHIPESLCYGMSNLASVTILNSVTSIGRYAFEGCSSLSSVTIPNSVTSIGNYAFNGCSGLTSVTIPNGVTSIEDYVFSGCSGLTSVTIPDSVTSIGYHAFYGCSNHMFVYLNKLSQIHITYFFRKSSQYDIIPDITII